MKKTVLKMLAVLLVFSICASLLPTPVFAVAEEAPAENGVPTLVDFIAGTATAEDIHGTLDESTVPAIIDYEEAVAKNHIARLYDDEGNDLNKIIFLNVDGSKTMYTFDFPVKYVDENGSIQDIRLEIADDPANTGGFETTANAAVTTFSAQFADGISLEGNDMQIRLIPILPSTGSGTATMSAAGIAANTATAQRIDEDTIAYPYDAKTTVEYSLTYTGFKEDIVVSEYTGQTTYPFRLLTNGLALEEIDGSFFLVDDGGNIEASIGDIIIFTADERNNAFGDIEPVTVAENQEYVLNIVVDAEYLADPATIYPIRIDPTIEIKYSNNGAGAVEDITVSTNTAFSGTYTSLYVGRRSTEGIARILMRFPGLDVSGLSGATVTSATVRVRDLMCEDDPLDVSCYVFTGSEWDGSSATWANSSPDSYVTTPLSTNTLSWSIGDTFTSKHWYTFEIKSAVQGWIDGNYNQNKGIIFKVASSVENGSTISNRTFGSYNRSSYQPVFSVTYTPQNEKICVREGASYALPTSGLTGTVTWESSNTVAATVNASGVVTGVHAGNTVVTASVNGVVQKTYNVYTAVADGVYYLKNNNSDYCLSVEDSNIMSGSNVVQEPQRTSNPRKYSQLWKITYLANGMYSIRPMHQLNTGLSAYLTDVNIWDIQETDSIDTVASDCQWTIIFSAYGYVLRHEAQVARTLVPLELSTTAGAALTVEAPRSLSTSYIWTLDPVQDTINNCVIFYDKENKVLTTNPVRYIAPEETKTCAGLKLYASFVSRYTNEQDIKWEVEDDGTAVINEDTGSITGNTPNSVTVVNASMTYNGTQYSRSYTMNVTAVPNGTYYLRNRQTTLYADIRDQAAANGTSIQQWDFTGDSSQKWKVTHQGDGTYTIRTTATTNDVYVGVSDNSTASGASVVLRTGLLEDGMIWTIQKTSDDRYKLIPKSGESANLVLAVNDNYSSSDNALQQLAYVNNERYNDEWYICQQIDIGMSTDNFTSGVCHGNLKSYLYANKFFDELNILDTGVPSTLTHHYNNDSNTTASKTDFANYGAISNEIDFMVYIGHGHASHGDKNADGEYLGNHMHYDCGRLEKQHVYDNNTETYTFCDSATNVYTNDMLFGSSNSDLRWVWLYTCNFLTEGNGVTETSLKEMMNGAHIVMGYESKSTLCSANAEIFAAQLRNGESIIDAFFAAGSKGEAKEIDSEHSLKVLYIPQARQETIYSPKIYYEPDTACVQVLVHKIQPSN